jgi:hypothetical protein
LGTDWRGKIDEAECARAEEGGIAQPSRASPPSPPFIPIALMPYSLVVWLAPAAGLQLRGKQGEKAGDGASLDQGLAWRRQAAQRRRMYVCTVQYIQQLCPG